MPPMTMTALIKVPVRPSYSCSDIGSRAYLHWMENSLCCAASAQAPLSQHQSLEKLGSLGASPYLFILFPFTGIVRRWKKLPQ